MKDHWGDGVAIDHGEFVDFVGAGDEGGDVEEGEAPGFEFGGEGGFVAEAVPVAAGEVGIGAEIAFGDPVNEAVVDGVADELLIGVAGHDHGAAGEEGRGRGDGAPEEAAGEFGVAFVGVEDVAGDGVDAVGADEDVVGLGRLGCVGVAVVEVGGDLVGVVVEGLEVVGGLDGVGAEAGGDGAPEEFEEAATVDGVLGPAVAGGEAAGFAPDAFAAFGVVGEFGGGDGGLGEFGGEAEVGKDSDGVGGAG